MFAPEGYLPLSMMWRSLIGVQRPFLSYFQSRAIDEVKKT